MKNKPNKKNKLKNYLPSIVAIKEDKTYIDNDGSMQEVPTIKDDLDKKIEPPPPRTPSL